MSNTRLMESKAAALARMQAMIAGLQKHAPNGQFTLGNVPYTTDALVTLFLSLIAAITAVNSEQVQVRDAVTALRGVEATVAPVYGALKRNLRTTYGTASQTLADFGLEAIKARAPLSGEEMAAAAAKAKATRVARGTTSKKAKLGVTGNVTGVTVTPNTVVPAPASPVAQPATATANAPSTGSSK